MVLNNLLPQVLLLFQPIKNKLAPGSTAVLGNAVNQVGVESQEENDFISITIAAGGVSNHWLGGSDTLHEGVFSLVAEWSSFHLY